MLNKNFNELVGAVHLTLNNVLILLFCCHGHTAILYAGCQERKRAKVTLKMNEDQLIMEISMAILFLHDNFPEKFVVLLLNDA